MCFQPVRLAAMSTMTAEREDAHQHVFHQTTLEHDCSDEHEGEHEPHEVLKSGWLVPPSRE